MHMCTATEYDSGKRAPRQGETQEKMDALSHFSPGIARRAARRGVVCLEGSAGLFLGTGPRRGESTERLSCLRRGARHRPTSACWLGNRLAFARIGKYRGEVGSLL